MACVKAIEPLPKPHIYIAGRYIPSHARKLAALEFYVELVKFLLPMDSTITIPHIWHSDLHAENISVNPEDPTQIVGIIDWQASSIVPLYENASQLSFLDYDGPPLEGTERPEFPKNLKKLDQVERDKAVELWEDKTLAVYYRMVLYHKNTRLFRAAEYRKTISWDFQCYAHNILIDGELIYLTLVASDLKEAWDTLPGVEAMGIPPFPFKLSVEELAVIEKEFEDMSEGMKCLRWINEGMRDFYSDDVTPAVSHANYDFSKRELSEYKEAVLEQWARSDEERAAVHAWLPFE